MYEYAVEWKGKKEEKKKKRKEKKNENKVGCTLLGSFVDELCMGLYFDGKILPSFVTLVSSFLQSPTWFTEKEIIRERLLHPLLERKVRFTL